MQESPKYAVGIDIGTTMVRCAIGHIDAMSGVPTIIGLSEAPNSGMRKGAVVNLAGPAQAIDRALGEAEVVSGYEVDKAAVNINGTHILSTSADGMIAVSAQDHIISGLDMTRLEEVATVGKIPANRVVLEVIPHSYRLDGQDGIKDPRGMTGTRLEVRANVVSAMAPQADNLQKSLEIASVKPSIITPSALASAKAVLSEQQLENGVALIDIGGATTGLAIYEEGDMQYAAVIPMGGINITNDLAIGLKTDPDIADKVKLQHAQATARGSSKDITVEHNKSSHTFSTELIDMVVVARLEEIFEEVSKEIKRAGRNGKLPGGVVLTGGTANLVGIEDYAKNALGVAAKVGRPTGFAGVAENIESPEYATVVGLMLLDAEAGVIHGSTPGSVADQKGFGGLINGLFNKFKSSS